VSERNYIYKAAHNKIVSMEKVPRGIIVQWYKETFLANCKFLTPMQKEKFANDFVQNKLENG